MGRTPALLGIAAALVAWFVAAPHLAAMSTWANVLMIALVLMPAFFGLTLVALPSWSDRRLPIVATVLVAVAISLTALHFELAANFAKFAAVTSLGWLFLRAFEALSWVALVAIIIPWVDTYSVWRGPTRAITDHHANVFTNLSIAFVVPGGDPPARLGLPDVLFFSVFLAATLRFGLRPIATCVCMTASLGGTIALTTYWETGGLPALPAISIGFLVANGDILWRRLIQAR